MNDTKWKLMTNAEIMELIGMTRTKYDGFDCLRYGGTSKGEYTVLDETEYLFEGGKLYKKRKTEQSKIYKIPMANETYEKYKSGADGVIKECKGWKTEGRLYVYAHLNFSQLCDLSAKHNVRTIGGASDFATFRWGVLNELIRVYKRGEQL